MKNKKELIADLNRRAQQIADEYPAEYHRLPEYRDVIDLRTELENEPDNPFDVTTSQGFRPELYENLDDLLHHESSG